MYLGSLCQLVKSKMVELISRKLPQMAAKVGNTSGKTGVCEVLDTRVTGMTLTHGGPLVNNAICFKYVHWLPSNPLWLTTCHSACILYLLFRFGLVHMMHLAWHLPWFEKDRLHCQIKEVDCGTPSATHALPVSSLFRHKRLNSILWSGTGFVSLIQHTWLWNADSEGCTCWVFWTNGAI